MTDTNWDEHYIKRGDPTKPTYYIIRTHLKDIGLFARYVAFSAYIRYALSKGWLPVVDMQNYPNPYLAPEEFGKENAWEYFFEQPLRIGLEQAYAGENVVLGYKEFPDLRPKAIMSFYENRDNTLTEWRMLVKLGLLKIKPALHEEILATRQNLFAPSDRVLGVLLRGTDYIAKRPKWHPIPPPRRVCGKRRRRKASRVAVQQNLFGDRRQIHCANVQKHFRRNVRDLRPRIC
ncbi:MAG: hypothetical protein IJ774_03425 [Selenomonadaceae bacterium]|nr:hypothetical protein [Selenomonadaceae bacterium]